MAKPIGKNDKNAELPEKPDSQLVQKIEAWIGIRLSEELHIAPAEIDIHRSLLSYGLDSVVAFTLTGELTDWLDQDLPATLFWDYPTLEALARYLADQIKDNKAAESLFEEIDRAIVRLEQLPEDESFEPEN